MPRRWDTELAIGFGSATLGIVGGSLGQLSVGVLLKSMGFDKESFPSLYGFVKAGIAGAIVKTCNAPVERIKLMIQYEDEAELGENEPIESAADCVSRIYKREGWQGFWRGNLWMCLRFFPTQVHVFCLARRPVCSPWVTCGTYLQAMNYAFKNHIKSLFPKATSFGGKLVSNILVGSLAGALSLTVVYPFDNVRTRMLLAKKKDDPDQYKYTSMIDSFLDVIRGPDGFLGLYRGFWVSIAGIPPFRGAYFVVNDILNYLLPSKGKGLLGLFTKFCKAQVAALSAAYASYPADTLRRRIQAEATKPRSQRKYTGYVDCFQKIVREEGISALFKGSGYNAIRTVSSALAVTMSKGEFQAAMKHDAEKRLETATK